MALGPRFVQEDREEGTVRKHRKGEKLGYLSLQNRIIFSVTFFFQNIMFVLQKLPYITHVLFNIARLKLDIFLDFALLKTLKGDVEEWNE